jgi:sugar/nucleoside kinase (ribokinase family)
MADIITVGGATRDITFLTDKGRVIETPQNLTEQKLLGFEYGAKIRSEEVYMNFGGGACNAAVSLAKMGLPAAVCTRIGKDESGRSILENLRAGGVGTDLVQEDEKGSSGFSFVVLNKDGRGERVIFVHKGAANDLEIRSEELRGAKYIYLTALCGDWEAQLELLRLAVAESGAKLFWNPGESEICAGRGKMAELLEMTSVLIVNKDEAIGLVKGDDSSGLSDEQMNYTAELLKVLKGWGPQAVVITDGKNGACLYEDGEILQAPAYIGEQVDTTGAGDAFGSGLLAGYVLTGEWETALKFGVLNSGATVTAYGAQNGILSREEAESRLGLVTVMKTNL